MAQYGWFDASSLKPLQTWEADGFELHGEYVTLQKKNKEGRTEEDVAVIKLTPSQYISKMDSVGRKP